MNEFQTLEESERVLVARVLMHLRGNAGYEELGRMGQYPCV